MLFPNILSVMLQLARCHGAVVNPRAQLFSSDRGSRCPSSRICCEFVGNDRVRVLEMNRGIQQDCSRHSISHSLPTTPASTGTLRTISSTLHGWNPMTKRDCGASQSRASAFLTCICLQVNMEPNPHPTPKGDHKGIMRGSLSTHW